MAGRFIDKLKKAARLDPIKKEITLEGGETVVLWVTPLTAAERERAKKDARSDDPNAFALQLLVRKAKDGEESVSSPVDLGPRLALEAFLGEEVGGLSLDGSDTDPELYRVALTPF